MKYPYTLETFIAARVYKASTGCWVCLGASPRDGYQNVGFMGKVYKAHRWVYEQAVGPIPDGMQLDHLCRNTSCVNPAHLEVVTHQENQFRRRVLACREGHLFTEENTYTTPSGERRCRTCRRTKHRLYMRQYNRRLRQTGDL